MFLLVASVITWCAVYRLYKVGPQLVNFVEELRNWYVRFNRKRLKGSDGEDECKAAVCTLFEVMMITIQLMVRGALRLCGCLLAGRTRAL